MRSRMIGLLGLSLLTLGACDRPTAKFDDKGVLISGTAEDWAAQRKNCTATLLEGNILVFQYPKRPAEEGCTKTDTMNALSAYLTVHPDKEILQVVTDTYGVPVHRKMRMGGHRTSYSTATDIVSVILRDKVAAKK